MALAIPLTAVALLLSSTDALNVKMPGINYTSRKGPDWFPDSTRCKSESEVQTDMYTASTIADKVRIYSLVDCNIGELILPAAKNAGLQVELGIWTTDSHDYLLEEKAKLAEIIDMGLYDDNIIGLHVGSETIYRKEIDSDTAISYMNEIRDYIRSQGKNTPVTITDVIDVYYANQQLIEAVDYISVNQFSFWEGVDVNEGSAFTLDRLRSLRVVAANMSKEIVIGETGWSSNGSDPSASIASPENQAKFFSDYFQMARSHDFDYYWYVELDSKWRVDNGEKEVEADFGVFYENNTMKSNFVNLNIGYMEPCSLLNQNTNLVLSEDSGSLYMSSKSSNWLVQEEQVWFFDFSTQQLRSKSSDRCLDAYQPWNGGIVHVFRCMDDEVNQKWTYENATGKLKHAVHVGFCLDTDPAQNNKVQLYGCSPNNTHQQWNVIEPLSF